MLYNKLQTRNAGLHDPAVGHALRRTRVRFSCEVLLAAEMGSLCSNYAEDVRALSPAAPAGAWSRDPQQTLLPGR